MVARGASFVWVCSCWFIVQSSRSPGLRLGQFLDFVAVVGRLVGVFRSFGRRRKLVIELAKADPLYACRIARPVVFLLAFRDKLDGGAIGFGGFFAVMRSMFARRTTCPMPWVICL